jgi:hypothetical protein
MPTLLVMIRSIDRLHADALGGLSCAAVAMGFDRLRRLYG